MTSDIYTRIATFTLGALTFLATNAQAVAQTDTASAPPATAAERAIRFGANEEYQLSVPDSWEPREPRSRILQHEFAVKNENENAADGRITMMSAGGSVEANLERWKAQFDDADSTQETLEIAETRVHLLDIEGTYQDQPQGPRGPRVTRREYRMLGAIFETGPNSSFFVKFSGPAALVNHAEASFKELVHSLQRS